MALQRNPSSFRDPSGYIFNHEGNVYRNVSKSYAIDYGFLLSSGLLEKLFEKELLVKHEVVDSSLFKDQSAFMVLKPEKIPVITYPYEWGFAQLRQAALLTLHVLQLSLEHGMILKDASAYNIQFKGYRPVFIDTLSFTEYKEGQYWYGYRQFCEHFLAPLCLNAYMGLWPHAVFKSNVEGINLQTASRLLPLHTWFKPAVFFHLHLHARSLGQHLNGAQRKESPAKKISKTNLLAMIDHLRGFIEGLKISKSFKSQWQDYDQETHYALRGKEDKSAIIQDFIEKARPSMVWDIGANDGFFSRKITRPGRVVLSMDSDPLALEKNYGYTQQQGIDTAYSLFFDIMNPSPDLGWANAERSRLSLRSKPDLIMMLAVIHHIVISNNVPFIKVAEYMADLAEWLIIEFVPENDGKIRQLADTAGKKHYNRENFEQGFLNYFSLIDEKSINDTERSILLFKRK